MADAAFVRGIGLYLRHIAAVPMLGGFRLPACGDSLAIGAQHSDLIHIVLRLHHVFGEGFQDRVVADE